MANRMKEDERIERIIRGLLRLPENRRCINCNSLGPQYVCTTFLTFVCTNCSGVHREFTHRVKSVSMAKFSAEEVSALQAGGNERAKQIYFKDWDTQRHSYPDGSNLHRLRDFIKHVYVDRKYTGEKSIVKLPTLRLNDKEESHSRKVSAYKGGYRSPHYEKRHERRHSERSSPGRGSVDGCFKYNYDETRSPRYAQENSRYGGQRRTPACFEVVDDRFRDDEYGNHRFSNTKSKPGFRSSDFQKNMDTSCSPVVRRVRDILGDRITPLQVGKLSKAIDGMDADGSAHNQKIAPSSDQGSIDRSPAEHKRECSGSLIDFNPDSEPLDAETIPQTQQVPHSDSGRYWASFERPAKEKVQAPSENTFESLLLELSVPSVVPASNMSEGPNNDALPIATGGNIPEGGFSLAASAQQMSAFSTCASGSTTVLTSNNMALVPSDGGAPQAADSGSGDSTITIPNKQELSNMQQCHPTVFSIADRSPIMQQMSPTLGTPNYQPWISSTLPNRQGPLSASAEQSSQAVSKSDQGTSSGVGAEPLSVETMPSGRMELPADLFTASYATVTAPVPGWQNGSPYGMGFSMQYYSNAMTVPAFPNSARSANPFDLSAERTQVQAPPFPSTASLQGALPNVSAASSLLSTQSSGLMAPQSPSYASAVPPHSPSFLSAMPPGAYMGLQVHNNELPSRSQGVGGFGSDGAIFGSLNTTQQSTGRYSAPSTPNPFSSMGGNPFV